MYISEAKLIKQKVENNEKIDNLSDFQVNTILTLINRYEHIEELSAQLSTKTAFENRDAYKLIDNNGNETTFNGEDLCYFHDLLGQQQAYAINELAKY